MSVSKLSIWLPKKLRLTVMSKPPMSACPPCFWPVERHRTQLRQTGATGGAPAAGGTHRRRGRRGR
jgi:hypothetical protein